MPADLLKFTERSNLVKQALGFPLIPERIGELASPLFPYMMIEPPLRDYRNQLIKHPVDSLLDPKIQIIGGSSDGLGYTATALLSEREAIAKKSKESPTPFILTVPYSQEAVDNLPRTTAQRVLLEVLSNPYQVKVLKEETQQTIREMIFQNLNKLFIEGHQSHTSGGWNEISQLIAPHLTSILLPPGKKDLDIAFDWLSGEIASTNNAGQNLTNIRELIAVTKKVLPALGYQPDLLLTVDTSGLPSIDESKKTIFDNLKSLGLKTRYIGPFRNLGKFIEGIPEESILYLEWDQKNLVRLIEQGLFELTNKEFRSLNAISDREVRGSNISIEEQIAKALVKQGKANPELMIKVVNNLLFSAATNTRQKIILESVEKEIKRIKELA